MKKNNEITIEQTGTSFLDEETKPNNNGLIVQQDDLRATSALIVQQVNMEDIDLLEEAEVVPINLSSEYWTPQSIGESKKVMFDRIDIQQTLSLDGSGEIIDLECVFFFVKENGSVKQMCNGSKRLVGSLQNLGAKRGAALEITYTGTKKNKSGPFSSATWDIHPLKLNPKS